VAQSSAADPPATLTEQRVAAIWIDVLETGGAGVNAGFLALGGDSVHAMRILARLNQTFGLDLSLRDLMNLPTIRQQAAFIDRILSP
jgi:acyl carrier protein